MTHPATTDALPLNEAELAAIRGRCDAATPGPWSWNNDEQYALESETVRDRVSEPTHDWEFRLIIEECYGLTDGDRAFVANSRDDVPRLLATIAERDRTITRLQAIEARAKEIEAALQRLPDNEKLWRGLSDIETGRFLGNFTDGDEQSFRLGFGAAEEFAREKIRAILSTPDRIEGSPE